MLDFGTKLDSAYMGYRIGLYNEVIQVESSSIKELIYKIKALVKLRRF